MTLEHSDKSHQQDKLCCLCASWIAADCLDDFEGEPCHKICKAEGVGKAYKPRAEEVEDEFLQGIHAELHVVRADVDAYSRSLRAKETPWAAGCAIVLESLWREVHVARSSTAAQKPVAWMDWRNSFNLIDAETKAKWATNGWHLEMLPNYSVPLYTLPPSATAATEQEPCAWRYRYGKTGMWKYADRPEETNPSPEYEREPLYPLPWAPSETLPSIVGSPCCGCSVPMTSPNAACKYPGNHPATSPAIPDGWGELTCLLNEAICEVLNFTDETPPLDKAKALKRLDDMQQVLERSLLSCDDIKGERHG